MGILKDDGYVFSVNDDKATITLNEGESLSSEIKVDCTAWINKYEEPSIEVLVRYQGSRNFHVAAHTEVENNILTWQPDGDDTLKPGVGWWQVRCISGEEIVALTRKWEMCILPSVPTEGTTETVTKAYVDEIVGNKQDALTFDLFPTENSENPVTSGGVKAAIDELTDQKVMDLKMEQSFDEETGEVTVTVSYADGAPVVTGLTAEDFANHSVRIVATMNQSEKSPMLYQQVMSMGGDMIIVFLEVFQGEIGFIYNSQTGEIADSTYSSWYEEANKLAELTADSKYGQYRKGEYYLSGDKLAKRISDNTNRGTENTDYVFTNVGAELETLNTSMQKTLLDLVITWDDDYEVPTISYNSGVTPVTGLTAEDFVNHKVKINIDGSPVVYDAFRSIGDHIRIAFQLMTDDQTTAYFFTYTPATGAVSNSSYAVYVTWLNFNTFKQNVIASPKFFNFSKGEYYEDSMNTLAKRITDTTGRGKEGVDFVLTSVGAELETLNATIASLEARIAALEGN